MCSPVYGRPHGPGSAPHQGARERRSPLRSATPWHGGHHPRRARVGRAPRSSRHGGPRRPRSGRRLRRADHRRGRALVRPRGAGAAQARAGAVRPAPRRRVGCAPAMRGARGHRGLARLGAGPRGLGHGPARRLRAPAVLDVGPGRGAPGSRQRRWQHHLLGDPQGHRSGAARGSQHAGAALRALRPSQGRAGRVAAGRARGLRVSQHLRQLRPLRAEPAPQAVQLAAPGRAPRSRPRLAVRGARAGPG